MASLKRKAETNSGFASIVAQLAKWTNEAAFKPVFEFYAGVLGRDQVRRKMIGRLGHEAGEILDEFLNFCLAEEQTGLPGLEAFLATLESAGPEIKREMDQSRSEVRIMTVHAAKGLEAPVVFLIDSGSAPFSDQHLPRLMPFESARGLWAGSGFLWRSAKEVANGFSQGIARYAKEKAEEEYRRLLYVGMTRAEDRLIVCGYHGKRAPQSMIWHAIVTSALTGDSRQRGADESLYRRDRASLSGIEGPAIAFLRRKLWRRRKSRQLLCPASCSPPFRNRPHCRGRFLRPVRRP